MALVWNPQSEFLREPNLLIPGKQPIGPVKIDWEHSYTKGLDYAALFRVGPEDIIPLVDNTSGFAWTTAGVTGIEANRLGLSVAASSKIRYENTTDTFADLGWDVDFSVVCVIGGRVTTTDIGIFGGSSFPQIWLDRSGGTLKPSMYTGSVANGSVFATGTEYWEIVLAFSVYQTTGTARNGELWLNGKNHISDASLGSSSYAISIPRILGASSKNGLLDGQDTWAYSYFIWNRRLNSAELSDLSLDPYQILMPA